MSAATAILRRTAFLPVFLGMIGSALAAPVSGVGAAGLGAGYTASDAPLGQPTELRIDLRGEVSARCRMASPPMLAGTLNFNREGDAQARFGLDCNAPFSLRVRSGEGGFAAEEFREGIARQVPYEIAVDVDTDRGISALGWCRSDQLSDRSTGGCIYGSGEGWSSGDATAINRSGTMHLRWNAPAEGEAPVLGKYRDTIVVELSVRS